MHDISLIEQGKPAFAIAVASSASPLLQTTAQEVAGYFKARFGSSPSVLSVDALSDVSVADQGLFLLSTF